MPGNNSDSVPNSWWHIKAVLLFEKGQCVVCFSYINKYMLYRYMYILLQQYYVRGTAILQKGENNTYSGSVSTSPRQWVTRYNGKIYGRDKI